MKPPLNAIRATRRQFLLWRLVASFVAPLALGPSAAAQTAEVHLADDTLLTANSSAPHGRLPVLFVHGHNTDVDESTNPNYRKNWQNSLNGLPSFKPALDLPENSGLGIEPYYIRFQNQDRSITEDAAEISDAVDRILHRHDPQYDYPHNPAQTSHAQVVIIAYSKGTISARQYLKSLQTQVPGLRAPEPDFRPVSEFIAIAPPNHGINVSGLAGLTSTSGQQLLNGYGLTTCAAIFPAATRDFIEILNGHPIEDTLVNVVDAYPSEAPGSRADIDSATGAPNPPTGGTLYVTIFADGNRDFVGGDAASGDCQGRRVAKNLSPDSVDIPLASITGNDSIAVHQNTVHTPAVICQALYAAVHHRSSLGQTCTDVGGVPVIPPPPRAAAMLTLDFSGSMSAPACPGCPTRAFVLKDAVELFVQLWSAVSVPSDRIGLIHFDTNVTRFAINNEALPLLSDAADDVITEVGNQSPGSSTALGNSLQQAIQTLSNPSVNVELRRVILFTDGMQNVNPMARIVTNQLTFVNEPRRPNSIVPPGAPTVLDPSFGIAVDTIGVGASEAFVDLLDDIATATGGRTKLTTAPNDDLRQFFVEELINALKGFSPQLVAYRRGSIGSTGNNSSEAFAVEGGPRRVVLKLSWKRGDSIDFSVAKDGVDVTDAGRFINGAFYKIFVIDLPAKGGSPINARGNWQLRIKGKKATAYETAAIVDGGGITYDAVFNAKQPTVGDSLDLVVRSSAGGRRLSASARVTATLMIPTTTAHDLIATNPPKELPVFEPDMTDAERQLLVLTQDPKEWAKLRPRRQTVVLKRSGKDIFSTRLRPQVPGIYTAVVTIDGEAAKLGKFSRTMTATTVVRAREPANRRQ